MKRNFIVLFAAASICLASFGRPSPSAGHHAPRAPMHGPRIQHAAPPHHRHHHSVWGRGGSHFWPGFVGGLVGSTILGTASIVAASPPPPAVIAAPRRVWIPPVYGERPVYRAGIYVGVERYVITPGYWTSGY